MNWTASEFVARHVATVTGHRDATIPEALHEQIFNALTRREEIECRHSDQWGNWEWPFNQSQRDGKLYRPWLDEMVQEHYRSPGVPSRPAWPDGKSWALCLTHDVDAVSQWARRCSSWRTVFRRHSPRRRPARVLRQTLGAVKSTLRAPLLRGRDPLWCYERWTAAEKRHGFKSSMLFFPATLSRRHEWDCSYRLTDRVGFDGSSMTVKEMIRRLSDDGFDCGLHGSYHSYDDAGMLAAQKREIEDASGREVVSVRQHYLHYHAARTPRAQAASGLQVDSTQGFNRSLGFRAGTSFPFWCWDHEAGKSLPLLEVPMVVMDGALFSTGAMEYDHELAAAHVLQVMDAVAAAGGCLTLNWHLHLVNDPVVFGVYETLLAEAKLRGAWGCTLRDVLEHRRLSEARS